MCQQNLPKISTVNETIIFFFWMSINCGVWICYFIGGKIESVNFLVPLVSLQNQIHHEACIIGVTICYRVHYSTMPHREFSLHGTCGVVVVDICT